MNDAAGAPPIRQAQLELGCADLDADLRFFTEELGFRLDAIFPADDPAVAELSGYGLALRLRRGARDPAPARLRLLCDDPAPYPSRRAPNGTRVDFVAAASTAALPPLQPSLTVSRYDGGAHWQRGRAGMRYRDLIPDRQGGRYIASHIRIDDGGPVPDYVHYHQIRFQMIYCYRGWVELVYEDQGPPFVMRAGDCVLQPPQIRHRVLESSAGLEVIEIGCPAEHPTLVEHELTLPTATLRPERDFGGQRFAFHKADRADWRPWRDDGFVVRDFGFADATAGVASAGVVKTTGEPDRSPRRQDAEFCFWFVLDGELTLTLNGDDETLGAGDCCVLPAGTDYRFCAVDDAQWLEVKLPAAEA